MKTVIMFACAAMLCRPSFGAVPADWDRLRKEIVEINSGTENIEGLEAVRAKLIPAFKALGFKANKTDLGGARKLLVFDAPGSRPRVAFVGHIDTVFPRSSAFQNHREDGEREYGPGVSDMKGGVTMMGELLSELRDRTALGQVRIVLNDDEETGSNASKAKMRELVRDIPDILVFEPSTPGDITISHSGAMAVKLTVVGKSAHAGKSHKEGVNACVELARKIGALARLTDYDRGVTVSPDVMSGGSKSNVICEEASVEIDVRYVRPEDHDRLLNRIKSIAAANETFDFVRRIGTRTKIDVLNDSEPMAAESTRALYKTYLEAARQAGVTVVGTHKGGTDSYSLSTPGKRILSGLGPSGDGYHTEEEFLAKKATSDRQAANRKFLEMLLKPARP